MRLFLKDAAYFKYVDMTLNGITVLSGENNTGKSVIAKLLYSILSIPYHKLCDKCSVGDPVYNVSVADAIYGKFGSFDFLGDCKRDGHIVLRDSNLIHIRTSPIRVRTAPTDPVSTNVLYINSAELLDHSPSENGVSNGMHTMYKEAYGRCDIHSRTLFSKISNASDIFDYQMIRKAGQWFLYKSDMHHPIPMSQMSPAIKIFALIRFAVEYGVVGKGDVIILDGVDSYMHPKWQLVLAELIARLYESVGIKLLIITHSPYLLEGIEVYSKMRDVEDSCKWYLLKSLDDGKYTFDVTHKTEEMFKPLADPFQVLDNVRYS